MIAPISRQERCRSLLETFLDEATSGSQLKLTFYPRELIRFKKEFPELDFTTIDSKKNETSKKIEVNITKI